MRNVILSKAKFCLSFLLLLVFGVFFTAGKVSAMESSNGQRVEQKQRAFSVKDLLSNPPELKGKQVVLRRMTDQDIKPLSKILCAYTDKEIHLLFDPSSRKFGSTEEAAGFLKDLAKNKENLLYTVFARDSEKKSEKVVGLCSICFLPAKVEHLNLDFGNVVKFFMFLDRQKLNRGIGTDVANVVMKLLQQIKKDEVSLFIATAWKDNDAVVKLINKGIKELTSQKHDDAVDQSVNVGVEYDLECCDKVAELNNSRSKSHKKTSLEATKGAQKKRSVSRGRNKSKKNISTKENVIKVNHELYAGLVVTNKTLNIMLNALKNDKKQYDVVVKAIVEGFTKGKFNDENFWSEIIKKIDLSSLLVANLPKLSSLSDWFS